MCTFTFQQKNSRFDIIGVRTWSSFFLSDFTTVSCCYNKIYANPLRPDGTDYKSELKISE